ncbi:hypothetical protein CRG98_031231 [Punica granatum]|uniref:Uncharacterized protein n=1 Tax=Punica granatum TaxID=22663 RepID=A0A2I0IWK2_PUNGR|nr:hypothetical protein CRG98_031231 [Punica granatum]
MVKKVLFRHNYFHRIGFRAHGHGILHLIKVEKYKNRRGVGLRLSCHEIIKVRNNRCLHKLAAYYRKIDWAPRFPISLTSSSARLTSSETLLMAPLRLRTTLLLLCHASTPSPRRFSWVSTSA